MGYVIGSSTVLYLQDGDYFGQRLKYLLSAKNVLEVDVVNVDINNLPNELKGAELPMLVDRDIRVSGFNIISEFLHEKYPSVSLLGDDLFERTAIRTQVAKLDYNLSQLATALEFSVQASDPVSSALRVACINMINYLSKIVEGKNFVIANKISCIDVMVVPFIHRLAYWGFGNDSLPLSLMSYFYKIENSAEYSRSLSKLDKAKMLD